MTRYAALKSALNPAKGLLLLVAMVAVSACSTPSEPETYRAVTFDHLSRLNVDAAMVDVQMIYRPPLRSPNVEHVAPVSFQTAVNTWADRRFMTRTTSENRIVVTIKEASITEKMLPTRGGVTGALKKEQEFEYESVLDVEIKIIGLNDRVLSDVTSRVWQRRTILEDSSPYEKRQVWLDLVEDSVNELNTQLEPRFRQYFAKYIQY